MCMRTLLVGGGGGVDGGYLCPLSGSTSWFPFPESMEKHVCFATQCLTVRPPGPKPGRAGGSHAPPLPYIIFSVRFACTALEDTLNDKTKTSPAKEAV